MTVVVPWALAMNVVVPWALAMNVVVYWALAMNVAVNDSNIKQRTIIGVGYGKLLLPTPPSLIGHGLFLVFCLEQNTDSPLWCNIN